MSKIQGFTYEIVFKSGATLILERVADITLEIHEREISKFDISSTPNGDELKFINIGDIVSVTKKGKGKSMWTR